MRASSAGSRFTINGLYFPFIFFAYLASAAFCASYFGVSLDYLITGRPPRDAPVQQIIGNNNSNNIANVAGNVGGDLTEYERELLKVCESFDMRYKTALLMYAYDLEKEIKKNKE